MYSAPLTGVLCLLLASFAAQSPAQSTRSDSTADKDPKPKLTVLQLFALDLLKGAGEEAAKIEDRRSAARLQLTAAEAVWSHDQAIARTLFRGAFESALTAFREGQNVDLDPVTRLTGISTSAFCLDVIRRINTYDVALGRELSESFNNERPESLPAGIKTSDRQFHDEHTIIRGKLGVGIDNELTKARSLVWEKRLTEAVVLAKSIVSKEFPRRILHFVWDLAERDRAAADQFYLWLLANILEDETAGAARLQFLAPYAFGGVFLWFSDGLWGSWGGQSFPKDAIAKHRDIGSEQILADWFIDVTFAVLSRTAASNLAGYPDVTSRIGAAVHLARWLEPQVARSRPALSAAWRNLIDNLAPRLLPEQESILSRLAHIEPEVRERSIPEWRIRPEDSTDRIKRFLARAGNERDPAKRDYLYQEAAIEADRSEDRRRALEIVDKISDPDFRHQVRDWINYNAATHYLNEGRPDIARQFAAEIYAPDQRTSLFCALARIALKEKDETGASVLLNEAEDKARDADASAAKARALIMLANQFSRFDPTRTYQIMIKAIETANKIPDFGLDQAKLVRNLKNAAVNKQGLLHNPESVEIGIAMTVIAKFDFDGALQLCQSLENKSLRLSATIDIAALALKSDNQKKAEK